MYRRTHTQWRLGVQLQASHIQHKLSLCPLTRCADRKEGYKRCKSRIHVDVYPCLQLSTWAHARTYTVRTHASLSFRHRTSQNHAHTHTYTETRIPKAVEGRLAGIGPAWGAAMSEVDADVLLSFALSQLDNSVPFVLRWLPLCGS